MAYVQSHENPITVAVSNGENTKSWDHIPKHTSQSQDIQIPTKRK